MSKVFIVEDDEIIAKMVAEHLKSWKMEVRCANGLKNVTEEIKEFSPDIVLMDINLPYYNGFYWCAEIGKASGGASAQLRHGAEISHTRL